MKWTTIGAWGVYPKAESATSCYLVEKDGFSVVIDMGSGALSRLQQYITVNEIDAIVISHFHHDHVADIGPFQYACLVNEQLGTLNGPVPIYAAADGDTDFDMLDHVATAGRGYDPNKPLHLGPFTFKFMKTKHPKTCYAMRVTDDETTVVYTADTAFFPELTGFTKDVDLLIAESSFYDGMDGSGPGHMTSTECGRIAEDAGVGKLWLTHLPHFGHLADLVSEAKTVYNGEVELAREGLCFNLRR
ncbi:MBL fold metallo-hydrolase [Alkalibacillus salilacus]|uniref:Ribonuclease BN (tRNA processing enzyme) n=1 Tax=Alkalibacillus salilacus TaxID=284582 RepID=A0ABT9VGK9_9BACI|nr:MBL fold metallo-hydrolase [Alkalibacillus salilacus]MDQ0159945.1 ribonuclease BN (tRNA processing enzyme) [Alkalibacillus salilacus]